MLKLGAGHAAAARPPRAGRVTVRVCSAQSSSSNFKLQASSFKLKLVVASLEERSSFGQTFLKRCLLSQTFDPEHSKNLASIHVRWTRWSLLCWVLRRLDRHMSRLHIYPYVSNHFGIKFTLTGHCSGHRCTETLCSCPSIGNNSADQDDVEREPLIGARQNQEPTPHPPMQTASPWTVYTRLDSNPAVNDYTCCTYY